jgi:hypothetical protein
MESAAEPAAAAERKLLAELPAVLALAPAAE